MKKILAFCLCFCMIVMSFTGVAWAAGTMDVELTSDRYGHIYTELGQTFKIDVKNTLSTDFNGKIVYDVLSGGSSIYSEVKDVNISAGGTYTDFPAIVFPKYGIFELKATITDGNTVYGTDTIPFSFINASKNGEGSEIMYVNTHIEANDRDKESTVNAVRDAGFGGLRCPVYWFQVEEFEKNEYKLPDHAASIKAAAEMGMEPLVILSGGNGPWGVTNEAENNLNMAPDTDTERQAFANYCAYIATQFKGYVKHYEIWNEFTMPSNGGDKSAANYAKLLIAASKAIKAVDHDAKVVAMCTAGLDWNFINGVTTQLSLNNESNCYDILSVHPYTYGTSHVGPNTSTLKAIKFLAGSKPIWFTERGWDTSTTVDSQKTNGISDKTQAIYGVKDYLNIVSNLKPNNYCERFFWYDFQDDGADAAEREDNFGLIESVDASVPGAAKPSYIAFAALNKLVGRSDYKSVATSGNANAYRFTDDDGDDTYVLTGNVGNQITVNMTGKLELLDMYSNVVAIDDNTDGSFAVTLTEEVMYVRKHYEPAGCEVSLTNGLLSINGHSEESNQQVSLLVTAIDGSFIYAGQTTCDNERAYSFTADTKGINELYVKVNYGSVYNTGIETGVVLKLMCNGERILSLDEVKSTDVLDLVVSVSEGVTVNTDVYYAIYNGIKLEKTEKLPLLAGSTGDSIRIDFSGVSQFDKISGFVWENNMKPVNERVDFD